MDKFSHGGLLQPGSEVWQWSALIFSVFIMAFITWLADNRTWMVVSVISAFIILPMIAYLLGIMFEGWATFISFIVIAQLLAIVSRKGICSGT